MQLHNIFTKPIVTEKGTMHTSNNVYMFEVHTDATKTAIKGAIESLYKVKVADVHVMTRKGKTRRTGRRMVPKQLPDKKIALIHVKEGSIDLFPKA